MNKIKPLADRVLIRPDAVQEKTKTGLIVPEVAQRRQKKGIVVAAGPGTSKVKMAVKKDDHIAYGQHAGTEIIVDGIKYIMMRQTDILAIL